MIGSPGDNTKSRSLCVDILNRWNADRSVREKVVIRPVMWEYGGSRVRRESDAQAELNWMVDSADMLFAFFNANSGTPTPRAQSGTVEEIDRALDRQIPVHLYIPQSGVPRSINPSQLADLQAIEQKYRVQGLVGYYGDPNELERMLRSDLEADVADALGHDRIPVSDAGLTANYQLNALGDVCIVIKNEAHGLATKVSARLRLSDGTIIPIDVGRETRIRPGEVHSSAPIVGLQQGRLDDAGLEVTWLEGRTPRHSYVML